MDFSPSIWIRLARIATGFGLFSALGRKIFGQRIFAIALLTMKAAFRFRLFPVLVVLLLLIVFGLPAIIRHDGTARGFMQIVLTYTIGFISAILGLSTLWVACGTLARDVEECQMQMVAVKPIARWQIWLGKWLGLMLLNALLLGISGVAIYGLIQNRAGLLHPEQQTILRNELLVGRGSFHPPVPELEKMVDAEVAARLKETQVTVTNMNALRDLVREQIKTVEQIVPPMRGRRWQFDLGIYKDLLRDQPLYLRFKFFTSEPKSTLPNQKTYGLMWQVGPPESAKIRRREMNLTSETFHEIELPPNCFDDQGVLTADCFNMNENMAMLVPLGEGVELLYHESGFAVNLARGLAIIFLWLGLLAALGLAAASFLSFPVAAFAAVAMLLIALSSGTLLTVAQEGSVFGFAGAQQGRPVDRILVPVFKVMVSVLKLVLDFSPIDSLTTGRSITWGQLGHAFAQILFLFTGGLALFGITAFTRRELATAQGSQ